MQGRSLYYCFILISLLGACQSAHDPFDRPFYGRVIPDAVTNPGGLVPHVILTNYTLAYRCSILINDMKLPYEILPKRPVPYSPEASGTIFVGYYFPYEQFKEIMTFARNYYAGTKYIELSDPSDSSQKDSLHYALILGAKTERGMTQGLNIWSETDFKQIRSIASQDDMRNLLRSRMQAPIIDIENVEELSTDVEETEENKDEVDVPEKETTADKDEQ